MQGMQYVKAYFRQCWARKVLQAHFKIGLPFPVLSVSTVSTEPRLEKSFIQTQKNPFFHFIYIHICLLVL